MKITLDTKTGICKIGSKEFKEAKDCNQSEVINELRKFIIENSKFMKIIISLNFSQMLILV